MSENYELLFSDLCHQIVAYSPASVAKLQHIYDRYDARTAFYAAFIIVCLRAQEETIGIIPADEAANLNLQSFTFFEFVGDDERALRLFDDLLLTYRAQQCEA